MSDNLAGMMDAASSEFKENYVAKPTADVKTDARVNLIKNKKAQGIGSISNTIAFKDTITGSTFTITVGATHVPDQDKVSKDDKGKPSSTKLSDAKLAEIQEAVNQFLSGMHSFI